MFLIVNAGSSSLKLVFCEGAEPVLRETVGEIGADGHARALETALSRAGIPVSAFSGAAHRVVHGGPKLTATCRITAAVTAEIAAAVPLAPLHNPASLVGIQAVERIMPDLPQYACFDTAFHATNPPVATTYALPLEDREQGIRRYGFHGTSYAALVRILKARGPLPSRLLACHLGNGASLCAIVNGRSVATTMGYSPLDGLTMGSRAGSIDGNAVLRLVELHGLEQAKQILNRASGLIALGGSSDLRRLHEWDRPEARFALEHFAYWAVRHAGSMVAAMGGLDAVVFTGGIGENDGWMRKEILTGLRYLGVVPDLEANNQHAPELHDPSSSVAIWIVPADEERQIALEAQAVMAGEGA
ncbi:MAG: acetate kinase [Rhodobacter sp.]|nr:acetate kinase [Rhodobacter sp.]